jgi:Ca-activated chloride channel family protein
MSFQSPLLLLALALIPAGVALYLLAERSRRRRVEAWASTATMPSVVPRAPGWRRHAPIALYGLAMAGLVVALARPQATFAVPVEQASIVLATDHSGSMQATDVAPSRLVAAREAGERFLEKVPDRVRVGAVAFDDQARALQSPTTDHQEVRDALREALKPSGGTATGDALSASLALLRAPVAGTAKRPPSAIVLLSDGASTHGRPPLPVADEAKRLGIPIYTVALGTAQGTIQVSDGRGGTRSQRVPPDVATLREIARRSGGRAFTAADSGALSAVYERLGSQVATRKQPREVTSAFAGGALLLLAGGAGLSLRWFRRLV